MVLRVFISLALALPLAVLAEEQPGNCAPGLSLQQRDAALRTLAGDDTTAFFGVSPRLKIVHSHFPMAYVAGTDEITITSGLLCLIDSIDEYAFVLAHEIGHLMLKHAGSARSLTGGTIDINHQIQRELEADSYAVLLLEDSGFDSRAGQSVLQKIARFGSFAGLRFDELFPSIPARTEYMKSFLHHSDHSKN